MTNGLSGFPVANDDQQIPILDVVATSDEDSAHQNASDESHSNQQQSAYPPQQLTSTPATQQFGGMAKEQLETPAPIDVHEKVPIVETRENEAVPEEVSSWMEKLEQGEDIQLPQPVMQDDQVLVSSATTVIDEDKIVLPLTEEEVKVGLHQKVFTGARWLAEWCVRLVKKFHGHVVYRLSRSGGGNEPG